jgi:hypothetical protein
MATPKAPPTVQALGKCPRALSYCGYSSNAHLVAVAPPFFQGALMAGCAHRPQV